MKNKLEAKSQKRIQEKCKHDKMYLNRKNINAREWMD